MSLVDYDDDDEEEARDKNMDSITAADNSFLRESDPISNRSSLLFDRLPPPSNSTTTQRSSVHENGFLLPRQQPIDERQRKVTAFTVPIKRMTSVDEHDDDEREAVADEDDERRPRKRRAEASSRGVLSFLPPPKNSIPKAKDLFDDRVESSSPRSTATTSSSNEFIGSSSSSSSSSFVQESLSTSTISGGSVGWKAIPVKVALPPPKFDDDDDDEVEEETYHGKDEEQIEEAPQHQLKQVNNEIAVEQKAEGKDNMPNGTVAHSVESVHGSDEENISSSASANDKVVSGKTSTRTNVAPTSLRRPSGSSQKKRIPLSFKQHPGLKSILEEQKEDIGIKEFDHNEPNLESSPTADKQLQTRQENNELGNVSTPHYYHTMGPSQQQQFPPSSYHMEHQSVQYYGEEQQDSLPLSSFPNYSNIPREFRNLIETPPEKLVSVNASDLHQNIPHYREPFANEVAKPPSSSDWQPTRNHRRQNHASFLVWDIHRKAAELEMKRAESLKTKKETRSKYGW